MTKTTVMMMSNISVKNLIALFITVKAEMIKKLKISQMKKKRSLT